MPELDIQRILCLQVQALHALINRVGPEYQQAFELMQTDKLIAVTGVGKSGHVAAKVASTLTSLGSPTVFVHPTEAAHGDLGLLSACGAVLAFSRSGVAKDTRSGHPSEVGVVVAHAKRYGLPVVLVSENTTDGLALMADVTIPMPASDEGWGHAPTSSTTLQIAIGDALACCLADHKGFTEADFQANHPGGYLGTLSDDGILAFSKGA